MYDIKSNFYNKILYINFKCLIIEFSPQWTWSTNYKCQEYKILFWSSNVINFLPAWQTDFSFESQHQGIGDIKISNCHVYGMADMSLHGTWYFRKERSRAQLHTVTEELLEKDVSMITDGYYSGYTTLYNT